MSITYLSLKKFISAIFIAYFLLFNRILKSQEDDDNEPIGEAKALGLNFETIHNIDEYATETVTTMREALKVN